MELVALEGSLDLLRDLINGNWQEEDFLILNPRQRSKGIYDLEKVIGSEDVTVKKK